MTQESDDQGWYGEDAATFGDRLAAAREWAGLSQEDLAVRLGVKPVTLKAWEEDLKEPRANRLQMLSGMLNISLAWLLTGTGEGPDGPADSAEISNDVKALLVEMAKVRVDIVKSTNTLARLEKQLNKALRTDA